MLWSQRLRTAPLAAESSHVGVLVAACVFQWWGSCRGAQEGEPARRWDSWRGLGWGGLEKMMGINGWWFWSQASLGPSMCLRVNTLVVSDSLRPHGLQHTRLPGPSLSPGVYSNLRPVSRWCHPTISSSVSSFLLWPSVFPSTRVFLLWVGSLHQVAKVLELPLHHQSNEYSRLISFRIEWFDLLAIQENLKSLL